MDEENYMTDRVDNQIAWYSKRSGQYQRRFKQIRFWQISCASSIPFLTGFVNEHIAIQTVCREHENIISKENCHWAQQMSKKKDEQKHDRK